MSQFGAAGKNPPWMRQAELPLSGGTMLAMAQSQHTAQTNASLASALNQQQATAAQQTQQFGANLAALGIAQNALQATTVLSQPGIAIPASLATTAPVGTLGGFSQAGMGLPANLATTPAAANMGYATQQRLLSAAPSGVPAPVQAPSQKQRVFTGTVTKLHDNFGFVDEDVFFQTCVIKGSMPKVGERVLVEASYNPNMPFKWNAYRIQLLANQMNSQVPPRLGNQSSAANHANANVMAAQTQYINSVTSAGSSSGARAGSRRMPSPPPRRDRDARHDERRDRYRDRGARDTFRDAFRDGGARAGARAGLRDTGRESTRDFDRDRRPYERLQDRNRSPLRDRRSPPPEREREREREIVRAGDKSPERDHRTGAQDHDSAAPSRKHAASPTRRNSSPPRRKQRLLPRYVVEIPSASLEQQEVGVIDLKRRYPSMYIPSDFFHASILWQEAFPLKRPLLLDHACRFHVLPKDASGCLSDGAAVLDPSDLDFSYSAKVMLLSTPSLEKLYQRTCALAEDPEDAKLGAIHPARVLSFLVGLKGKSETVAIGGPWSPSLDGADPERDPQVLIRTAIRTCRALTGIDLSLCTQWYRFAEICYRRESTSAANGGSRAASATLEKVVLFFPDVWRCMPTAQEWADLGQQMCGGDDEEPSQEEDASGASGDTRGVKEPTHYSGLDPKSMKIIDLRNELEARGLSTKGLKSQLTARLAKALRMEAEQNGGVKEEVDSTSTTEVTVEDDKDVKEETEKQVEEGKECEEEKPDQEVKEERAAPPFRDLPSSPAILAQPSKTAKGGRFDCTVMSLSLLLDYRPEDNKEHSFEVSLFAELFNEMLIRDFGFNIYRAILAAPEPKEDKKREKKDGKDVKESTDKKADRKDDRKADRKADKKEKEDEEQEDSDMLSDSSEGNSEESKDKRQKKEGKRHYRTVEKHLLLSFIYFDQNQCGYLLDKDLEEIFFIMGLKLSRGQVRRLLQKVSRREMVEYRKLTDFPVAAEESKTGQQESLENNVGLDLDEVVKGNRPLLQKEDGRAASEEAPVASGGLVYHEGALLDVNRLIKQADRSAKALLAAEARVKDVLEELEEVREAWESAQKSATKTQGELERCKKQLLNTEQELHAAQKQSQELRSALQNCHQHLQATLSSLDTVLSRKEVAGKVSIKVEKTD